MQWTGTALGLTSSAVGLAIPIVNAFIELAKPEDLDLTGVRIYVGLDGTGEHALTNAGGNVPETTIFNMNGQGIGHKKKPPA